MSQNVNCDATVGSRLITTFDDAICMLRDSVEIKTKLNHFSFAAEIDKSLFIACARPCAQIKLFQLEEKLSWLMAIRVVEKS